MNGRHGTLPAAAHAALVASLLITAGSGIGGRLTPIVGVPLAVIGFAWAWIAARRTRRADTRSFNTVYALLSVNAVVALNVGPPFAGPRWYAVAYHIPHAMPIVLVGFVSAGSSRARAIAAWIAVAVTSAVVAITPVAVPTPRMDVWMLTQTAARALLTGTHPYTVSAPDVYGGAYDFGYTATVYPYMPLGLVMAAPAIAVFGDYRFALAAAFPIAVVLSRRAARRLDVPAHTVDVVTLALAMQPWAYLVAAGWMEPAMIACAAAFFYLSSRARGGAASAVAFMLLPALKQYVVAPALLFVAMYRRPRAIAIGAAVAAMTVAPFLIWNWSATTGGITAIARQMNNPAAFRTDSTSVTALIARIWDVRVGAWLSVVAQLAGAAAALAVLPRGVAGLLLASAISLLASFLVGTQAFINYYAFAASLLLFAALALAGRPQPL